MPRPSPMVALVVLALVAPALGAERATQESSSHIRFLPASRLFEVPAADVTKPRFEVSWQRWRLDDQTINVGRASLGSELPLIRWEIAGDRNMLEWGLDAGVLAVFNLDGRTQDLLNADYSIGMPLSWRYQDVWSARIRLYHASSHLGDEFLLFDGQPFEVDERLELSFEALEALASLELSRLRLYAGGTRILSSATAIDRNRAQAGAEYRLLRGANTAIVFALDLQSWEETDWELQTSLRVAASFFRADRPARSITLFLEGFDGPLPYGQLYVFDVSWVGLGVRFRL